MLSRHFVLAALFVVAGLASTEAQVTMSPGPQQPLPYSHKQHLAMNLQCALCHEMPDPGAAATFPPTSTCMTCHIQAKRDSPAIQQLAAAHAKGEAIPWVRVYRLPDFVFFSHKTHVTDASVTCDACHGEVKDMEVMRKAKDISMAACMDCHQSRSARVTCTTCHDSM